MNNLTNELLEKIDQFMRTAKWKAIILVVIGLVIGGLVARWVYHQPNLKARVQTEYQRQVNKGEMQKTMDEIHRLEQLKKTHRHSEGQ